MALDLLEHNIMHGYKWMDRGFYYAWAVVDGIRKKAQEHLKLNHNDGSVSTALVIADMGVKMIVDYMKEHKDEVYKEIGCNVEKRIKLDELFKE